MHTAKYLGVYIGLEANAKSWEQPCQNFTAAIADIRQQSLGYTASLYAYNSRAVSKFSYVVQSHHCPDEVLVQEVHALSLLAGGPYRALPCELVTNMKLIGLPTQAVDLMHMSFAAKARFAFETSTSFVELRRLLHDVMRDQLLTMGWL